MGGTRTRTTCGSTLTLGERGRAAAGSVCFARTLLLHRRHRGADARPRSFANPLEATADRFCWDFWHVENQCGHGCPPHAAPHTRGSGPRANGARRYTLLRSPADAFFPRAQYQALEAALLEFGERELGCRGMSPPWVACYVDGCRQVCTHPHAVLRGRSSAWATFLGRPPSQELQVNFL